MSRIDELIQQLCPDGVEYKPLGELCFLSRGKVISKDYLRDHPGIYPVFSSQTADDGVFGRIDSFEYDGEYLTWTTDGANAGSVFFRSGRFNITNVCGLIKLKLPEIRLRFLFYWLRVVAPSYVNAGMGNPKLMSNVMGTIQCPVPPLPVQKEIVRILDKFTALEAELEAELEARRKQYEFYRDQLLTFGDEVEWKPLGEIIISLKTGLNPRKNFNLNTPDANNYYVTVRELNGTSVVFYDKTDRINDDALRLINNRSKLEKGDLLFSGTGTIGRTAFISENPVNWNIKEGVYVIKPQQEKINPKYLLYILNTTKIRQQIDNKVVGSPVSSIPMAELKKIYIPLPPLAEQERIVAILDKFDALVNDISSGLPAELEMRRKQYEYYRDRLLTFKPLAKEA